MKQFLTICAALAMVLAVAPNSHAETDYQYGWTISDSNADPFSNSGVLAPGVNNLFLWYQCNVKDGMSAAEFDAQSLNAANLILAFTPANGFLNAGGATNLLLAVGACPPGPVMAGNFTVLVNAPGEYCIVPAASNGNNVTVDCRSNPEAHLNMTVGYSDGGVPACDDRVAGLLCTPVSVDATSWGQVKGLYR